MISQTGAPIRRHTAFALITLVALVLPLTARALRVVDYNILNYPGSTGSARATYYRTILAPLAADIIVTEEMSSASGPTQFLNEVLNVMEPGQWATVPLIDGNDTDASLFYKPAKVQFLEQSAFYPNPANQLRYVHVFRVRPVGYASAEAELRLYATHLKASTGYEAQRLAECVGIREHMNSMPAGTHALLCGDMNFYKQSSEPGYAKLLESESNNIGRVYDLLPSADWHDNASMARYHTQSPCLSAPCASGAATGGMDDRFDFILPTYNLGAGQGLAVIPSSCIPVGNDGLHLNKNVTDTPIIPEGAAYATALKLASDHLPLRIDLQLPAKINLDPALVFSPVIVGAPAQSVYLTVSNPALPPADSLNCTFAAPTGFTAPGRLAVEPGGFALAAIAMGTGTSGQKLGELGVSCDAPDSPMETVGLSGSVLRHASASFDSSSATLSAEVDFGDHEAGAFSPQSVRLHNVGFDALQARLEVTGAVILGASDRFVFVNGFGSATISATGQSYLLGFNDAGAALDSTYTATLRFTSTDEALPGAASQPELVVHLRGRVLGGSTDAADHSAPSSTRLYAPFPNPTIGATTFRLDLAGGTEGILAVFNPSGRCVAVLRQGAFLQGRHTIAWDGRGDNGLALSSGIYYLRFRAAGVPSQAARVTIVR